MILNIILGTATAAFTFLAGTTLLRYYRALKFFKEIEKCSKQLQVFVVNNKDKHADIDNIIYNESEKIDIILKSDPQLKQQLREKI